MLILRVNRGINQFPQKMPRIRKTQHHVITFFELPTSQIYLYKFTSESYVSLPRTMGHNVCGFNKYTGSFNLHKVGLQHLGIFTALYVALSSLEDYINKYSSHPHLKS